MVQWERLVQRVKLRASYHFDKQKTKRLLFIFPLWWIIDVLLTAQLCQQEWRWCPKNSYRCGWSLAVDDEILISLFINNWIWKCAKQEGSWTDWWKMLSSALQPLNYVGGRYLIVCGILEMPVCANARLGNISQAQLANVLAEFGEKQLYLTFLSVWVCQRMAGSLNHLPINV